MAGIDPAERILKAGSLAAKLRKIFVAGIDPAERILKDPAAKVCRLGHKWHESIRQSGYGKSVWNQL